MGLWDFFFKELFSIKRNSQDIASLQKTPVDSVMMIICDALI